MPLFIQCILILISSPWIVQAQNVTSIYGKVEDKGGTPIIGANLFIADTYEGTSSDLNGLFSFSTSLVDSHEIICSYLGFESFVTEIDLQGDSIYLEIHLKDRPIDMNEIVIAAGSFEASGERKREILKPLDIVTTAGATADIAGALNTLPGTMTVGESGRLFVRGGDGHETKTFIDGVQVQGFYSPSAPNTPSRSRFLPFMFRGTSFSTGGYSAEYGQALSSALILTSKPVATIDRMDISLLSVGADVSFTKAWEASSLAAKFQYTDIDPYFSVINQDIDWIDPPTSIEGIAAFRKNLGSKGILKLFGNINRSSLSLFQKDLHSKEIGIPTAIGNDYNYLNGIVSLGLKNDWNLFLGFSSTHNTDDLSIADDQLQETDWGWHNKITLKKSISDHFRINTGIEFFSRKVDQEYLDSDNQLQMNLELSENLVATYLEADVQIFPNVLARLGARVESRIRTNAHRLHPRISLAMKTGPFSQVSAAFGKFQQLPHKRWLVIANHLDHEMAAHYLLNYQYSRKQRTFRAEVYYKAYDQLMKFDPQNMYNPNYYNNLGDGFARGFDLFWRDGRSFDQIDYWISYSYLDTERNYLNYPQNARPPFASKHNLSIVYKHFVSSIKTQVGWTYTFASSRSYNDPNLLGFLAQRTPDYLDLSINFSYLARQNLIIHASVTNVFGRDNVFGYRYSDRMDAEGIYPGEAIRQPARRFLFLGCFLTLSKEQILNQLPNL